MEGLRRLCTVARRITASLDGAEVSRQMAAAAVDLCGASLAQVWLHERTGGVLRLGTSHPAGQGSPGPRPVADPSSLVAEVLASGRPTFRVGLDPATLGPDPGGRDLRAFVGLPLDGDGEVQGVLTLLFPDRQAFSEPERELMSLLAMQSAVALSNARRFEATERERILGSSVADLGRLTASGVEPLEIAGVAARWVRRLLKARFAVLLRRVPDSPVGALAQLAVAGELEEWLDSRVLVAQVRALVAMALLAGGPAVTPDLAAEPRAVAALRRHHYLEQAGYHSVLAVPILIDHHATGVIAVGDHPGRAFGAEDIQLAGHFAGLAAPMLERALGLQDEPVGPPSR